KDKVVAVAQGKKGEFVDIIDMDLRDVVKLIRGKKGTIVKLKIVRSSDKGINRKIISITRDKVDLEDQAAKMEYVDIVKTNKSGKIKNVRIAVIDLPSFYVDTKPKTFFQKPGRSAVSDMKDLLIKCNKDKVDGIILDLQRNGGGALDEAVDVAGLFLARGNIVIATDRRKREAVLADTDADLNFKGPLIITTSPLTASGAEIVAGALKDYNRALIVGSEHSYGKGSIQQVVPLSDKLGALKITIGEYFIADGKPTQIEGVKSDIQLPSALAALDIGEKFMPNPLPSRTLKSRLTDYYKAGESKKGWQKVTQNTISNLLALSQKRVGKNNVFKEIKDAVKKVDEQKKNNIITIASLLENVNPSTDKTNNTNNIVSPYDKPLTNDVVVFEALNIMTDWLTDAKPEKQKVVSSKQ
ncbi:MAG: tail-specific protease, partial [Chlamydiae bacterium]